jgi:response regulator NasT
MNLKISFYKWSSCLYLMMKQRKIDEDEAYNLLRSMAMSKKVKLVELAQQLLDAAELLIV